MIEGIKGIGVVVQNAEGHKCVRCWKILPEVKGEEGAELCERCEKVVTFQAASA